jgi:hypothetical protein
MFHFMKTFRAVFLMLISASVFCGCATTQQSSNSFPSNSIVRQDKQDAWQQWGYGILSFVGGAAYLSAADNMADQHP